ncbi:hypothetical protein NIES2101_37530 [Calothrix sp. HK-06]|nr:hypothetical protein NIES2101_37530 [Calothrix sp. HK-06]
MTFQPIAFACTASSLQNRFIVSGRGGIPANPSSSLRSETTWNDMRPISSHRGQIAKIKFTLKIIEIFLKIRMNLSKLKDLV